MRRKLYLVTLSLLILMTIVFYQASFSTYSIAHTQIFRQILQTNPVTLHPAMPVDSRQSPGNIPEAYFYESKKSSQYNATCARYPNLFDLKFSNDYWQVQKTSVGTFYLFNAYVDRRMNPVVRIVGMYDQWLPKGSFYCQFWYRDREQPEVVESEELFWLWRHKWGADRKDLDHPYLITCPFPQGKNETPASVSLVERPCVHATNNLKVWERGIGREKKNFVVCVKGMAFPNDDKSIRLAEWIELLNILGAEKVHFYKFNVHPATQKLLDYYVEQGKVELTPLTLIGDVSNQPFLQQKFLQAKITERRLQEVIPYNDCLYKHLNEFNYVVLLDTDEIIVPVNGTWVELMETLQTSLGFIATYTARNVYFLDSHMHNHDWFEEIPHYMHILQHVYRAENYTKSGYFVKGFHDTEKVVALHNHFAFSCLDRCVNKEISLELAHLQHYRSDCVQGVGNCESMKENSVVDVRVWNYKEELIRRVEKALRDVEVLSR